MAQRLVTVDGVQLCLETFGDRAAPALLLIGGGAASMDGWEVEFCERLAAQGRFVIRYDHRDTGRSTTCPPGKPTYTGTDLATDPLRILDALDLGRAHVVGLSMGGGIAQLMAARWPARVSTLTLIATSPAGTRNGQRPLPPMDPRLATTTTAPAATLDWSDRAAVVDHLVESQRGYAGALGFDEERARRLATTEVERARDIAASTNHWIVAGESASVEFRLAEIDVPTLVLHGTDDPLFPLAHGAALAAEIPGASLMPLQGMGHEPPPPQIWDLVVPAIARHTAENY